MTNLIAVLHRMVGTKEVIADLLSAVICERKIDKIVDIGSGSGGIMPEVMETLENKYNLKNIELTLTDLYPNKDLIDEWSSEKSRKIYYHPTAVDGADLQGAPEGLKTMINCFHHMKPTKARAILTSAHKRRESIFIYEMGENNIPLVLWWILLPISLVLLMIMVLFMTPWVRPMSWQQLVFTYLVPVIPLCYAWDGQASLPRMYTMKDLDILLENLKSADYHWKKGHATKKNKKKLGTYLIGLPAIN